MTEERDPGPETIGISDRLKAVGVLEAVALAIALVTPVTPSKTGSTWSPAQLLVAEPTYLQQVAGAFVVVNFLMAFLGIVVWLVAKRGP